MADKFLNLDAFIEEPGKVQFRGKTYEIPDVAVSQFLEAVKVQQELLETEDESRAVATVMDLVQKLVPGLPREELEAMTLKQLARLLNFVVRDLQGENPNPLTPVRPAKEKKSR